LIASETFLAIRYHRVADSVDWQVARAAGTEPIKYVKNIYIYYVAFKKLVERGE
jgi:hypothetical protein